MVPSAQGETYQNGGFRIHNVSTRRKIENTGTGNQTEQGFSSISRLSSENGHWTAVDIRKLKHEKRKKDILKILEPIHSDGDLHSSSVLICWGKESRCQIFPVKVSHSADDVTFWKEIRRAWYAHRGGWRSCLPLFSIREVNIVEVRRK